MKAQNLKSYIKANAWCVNFDEDEKLPNDMYLHKCDSPNWIMAEDKSHEYKIDVMYTFDSDTAIRLVMHGYALIDSCKNDPCNGKMATYLKMKRQY